MLAAARNLMARAVPPIIEYHARVALDRLGQPFNGQEARLKIVADLTATISFSAIVETGANLGASTTYMAKHSSCPVYTCEYDSRRASFCRYRLQGLPNVQVLCGNSVDLLRSRVIPDLQALGGTSFFYLDAHWYEYLPLGDELAAISEAGLSAVVMIDDFEVPGDAGYGYDDYGPGKRLCLAYLQDRLLASRTVYFPRAASTAETGARRGSVVLVTTSELDSVLRDVPTLRPYALHDVVTRRSGIS